MEGRMRAILFPSSFSSPLQTVLFYHSSISVVTLWPDAVSAVFPNDGHLISPPPWGCPVAVLCALGSATVPSYPIPSEITPQSTRQLYCHVYVVVNTKLSLCLKKINKYTFRCKDVFWACQCSFREYSWWSFVESFVNMEEWLFLNHAKHYCVKCYALSYSRWYYSTIHWVLCGRLSAHTAAVCCETASELK